MLLQNRPLRIAAPGGSDDQDSISKRAGKELHKVSQGHEPQRKSSHSENLQAAAMIPTMRDAIHILSNGLEAPSISENTIPAAPMFAIVLDILSSSPNKLS